jgi:RNA polymerase sigma factor (sigma-70 family)
MPTSRVLHHLQQALAAAGAPTDGQLLARFVAARDDSAFAALMRRHGPMVLGVCRRILRHTQDAEDAFQATFLLLARKAASVVEQESVGAWLHSVAFRTAQAARAANARRRARESQPVDLPHAAVAPEEPQDWRPLLDRELNALPEKYRVAVVLCELEGRPRREVARLLGIPEGTLSSRLAAARRLLAQRLRRRGLVLPAAALGAALAGDASAALPPALPGATTRLALQVAAGGALEESPVAALMKAVHKTMFLTRLKLALGATVVVAALAAALLVQPHPGQSAPAPAPTSRKDLTNSIGMKLVRIPAGKFKMGCPRDDEDRRGGDDQHEVEITRAFFLGAYTVTQAQYQKVMGKNPSDFSPGGWRSPAVRGIDTRDFPVECVSWDDALAFCKRLSALPAEKAALRIYRLPTEAEWEYACRAGTTTPFHFGKSLSSTQANFDGTDPSGGAAKGPFLGRTCKVGSYKPNAWGLYDMHGNVWQICADWFGKDYYRTSPRKDPVGPRTGSGRVVRGGAWGSPARQCRSAMRAFAPRGHRTALIGFRIACDVGGRR